MVIRDKWRSFWKGFGSIIDVCGFSFLYDQEIEDILDKDTEQTLKEDCEKVYSDFKKVFYDRSSDIK